MRPPPLRLVMSIAKVSVKCGTSWKRRLTGPTSSVSPGSYSSIENAFEMEEYEPGDTVDVGPVNLRFHEVPHFTETFAIDITSRSGGGRITYGADTRPGEELIEIARDTDLLIVEATLPRPERTGVRGHLTPTEAGEHARLANAKRVVLTH